MTLTFDQLYAAMDNISTSFDADYDMSYYIRLDRRNRKLRKAYIEGVAHELAHGLLLTNNPCSSDWIGEFIHKNMGDQQAQHHEIQTLRVQVAGLRELGLPVSVNFLRRRTIWRTKRPPMAVMQKPLTKKEKRCVQLFVKWVEQCTLL